MTAGHGTPRWRLLAAAVLTAQLLHGVSRVHASVVVPLSLTELTQAAALVVDATVVDVRAVGNPDGVERMVLVRVQSAWKGQPGDTLYIRLPGGRLGRIETRVPGVPTVDVGDRLVWFLDTDPRGGHIVLGLHQGALRTLPAADGDVRVLAPSRTLGARGEVRRAPRRLSDLAADVRELVSGARR